MTTVHRAVELAYPQEQVFDFLADLRNELLWHPDVESVEKTSDGAVGLGTAFAAAYRRLGRVEVTIDEYQRPWQLGFSISGRTGARYEHRLEARGRGSRVETTAQTRLRGLAWLLYPLLRGRVQRQFQERGELIAKGLAAAEREPAAP